MKNTFIILALLFSTNLFAQNTGIGTPTPTEKLDVNGNLNVNGNIKIAQTAGQTGQVLMTGSNGTTEWGDMCQYNNFVSFTTAGAGTWNVPTGITKILVEVWGAGGGANAMCSGAGGGYIKATFTVVAGNSINYSVGNGGTGVIFATASNGEPSSVTVSGNSVTANGGFGAEYQDNVLSISAPGGSFSVSGVTNYYGRRGQPGSPIKKTFAQVATSVFYEIGEGANGGDAANSYKTGGQGDTYIYNITGAILVRHDNGRGIGNYGGGGGCGLPIGSGVAGGLGGVGLVVIHY